MNVIMMIPTITVAPKIIHKHNSRGCDPWPLAPGGHLDHEDSHNMKVVRRPLLTFVVKSLNSVTVSNYDVPSTQIAVFRSRPSQFMYML